MTLKCILWRLNLELEFEISFYQEGDYEGEKIDSA